MDALKNIFNQTINSDVFDELIKEFFKGKLQKDSTEYIEQNFCNAEKKDIVFLTNGYWYHKNQVLFPYKR